MKCNLSTTVLNIIGMARKHWQYLEWIILRIRRTEDTRREDLWTRRLGDQENIAYKQLS